MGERRAVSEGFAPPANLTNMAPTNCPPFGVTVPCRFLSVRDGDTVIVHVPGLEMSTAVRLLDAWCCETDSKIPAEKKIGLAAKAFAQQVLDSSDSGDLRLFVPFPPLKKGEAVPTVFDLLTFDRILGYLFVGPTHTLNKMLVDAGLASLTKEGQKDLLAKKGTAA